MKIRPYRGEHYSDVKKLWQDTNIYIGLFDSEESLGKQIKHDSNSILVAEEDNKLIGVAIVLFAPWCSFVWHVAILPEYQKKGYGKELMKKIEMNLKSRGARMVGGYVEKNNKVVLDFYKKLGYNVEYDVLGLDKVL